MPLVTNIKSGKCVFAFRFNLGCLNVLNYWGNVRHKLYKLGHHTHLKQLITHRKLHTSFYQSQAYKDGAITFYMCKT